MARRLSVLALALWGCSSSDDRPPPVAADVPVAPADAPRDAGSGLDVAPVDPCAPAPCGPVEQCGAPSGDGGAGPGNGADDDCDGVVDEGCGCALGEARGCFPGPPDRRGVGACRDGTMRCTELGAWGACAGATVPADEACDGADDDCDGMVDEGLDGCASALRCPASAGAAPLAELTLDGRAIDPTARGFAWSVACPEGVSPCPPVARTDDPVLRYTALRSGVYRVTVEVERADGSRGRCRFPLYVQGRGLRVELDWDRKGGVRSSGTDMDLHVALIDRVAGVSHRWFTDEDCYFRTCRAPGGTVRWLREGDARFAPTPSTEGCRGAPPPWGERWQASGRCWNPRLDIDNVTCDPTARDPAGEAFCLPENVNVDDPPERVTFRLMVNFYEDHGTCSDDDPRNDVTHPVLAVFCGGLQRGEVGGVEDGLVPMGCRDNPGRGSLNWSWLAADVRVVRNVCGLSDCRVTALRVRPGVLQPCATVPPSADACADERGRVFVRRAGARPVDAELGESE